MPVDTKNNDPTISSTPINKANDNAQHPIEMQYMTKYNLRKHYFYTHCFSYKEVVNDDYNFYSIVCTIQKNRKAQLCQLDSIRAM